MLPVPGRKEPGVSKTDARILVLGPRSVGKSALTVRFLTKRFIGEYDSSQEFTYNFETLIDNNKVALEVLDATHPPERLIDKVAWADAFLLVYSITDENSFKEVLNLKDEILTLSTGYRPAIIIVGNKRDLAQERAVSKEVASQTVHDGNCCFAECSASNDYDEVLNLFQEVYHEAMKKKRERRMSLSPRPLRKALHKVFGGSKVPVRENYF